jgi:hypothetical protein
MKKTIFLLAVVFLLSYNLFSQGNSNTDANDTQTNFNELKINAAFLVGGAFEIGYERTINEESAFGISALIPFDNELKDDVKYYISPYYRFYFGKKYAAGFFVEGFGMLNSLDRSIVFLSGSGDDFVTDFALGFALGGKWVTRKGFSVELIYGAGRNLFNNEGTDYSLVLKGGINLGYRF